MLYTQEKKRYNIAIKIVAFIMAFFCSTSPFVNYPHLVTSGPTWLGLDVSWQMTLSYALKNNWVWGKDIVYTYGPLGFLATRIGLGVSKWIFLLFDAYLVFNFYCIFKDFLINTIDKFIGIAIVFIITLLMNPNHGGDLSWVVTIFSFYWMYKSYESPRFIYYALIVLNIVLCFYIKLNAGIIGFFFLAGHLLNMLCFKKVTLIKVALVILLSICMVLLASWVFRVELGAYAEGAIEIIKGYNDIMYMHLEQYLRYELNLTTLFFGIVFIYFLYSAIALEEKKISTLYFATISIAYVFLLRKQSIIRNDAIHYYEFFAYAPLVFLIGTFALNEGRYQKFTYPALLIVAVYSLFMITEFPDNHINQLIEKRYSLTGGYWNQFTKYDEIVRKRYPKYRKIPDRVLRQIAGNTIDIFPWDSEYAIENNLNYKPRPVFQSFSAYTEKLQEINYQSYVKASPMYILYDYDAVDGRYPYNDDCLLNFFICKNYILADSFVSNQRMRLLLKKRSQVKPVDYRVIKTEELSLSDSIGIDWELISMLKIDLQYSLKGKIESVFNRPSPVVIRMKRLNGVNITYKISPEMLKAGIMVDRWVNSTNDYNKYMVNKDMLDVIQSVSVVVDTTSFVNRMNVKYVVIN